MRKNPPNKSENSYIDKLARIHDNVNIDEAVYVGAFCLIGSSPEIKGFTGPGYGVVIRSGTTLTGFSTVDAGSKIATEIGRNCLIMKHCHIGHDVVIGNNVTMSPYACVGGHSVIWPYAVMGMHSVIHQNHELAPGAMLGMGCVLPKSAKTEPFTIYTGNGQRLRDNYKLIDSLTAEEVQRLTEAWNNRNK